MFDDILGPREEKVELKRGSGVDAASVGGVDSPQGMDPNKKPVPPSIGGLKGRPIGSSGPIPTPGSTPVNSNKTVDPNDLWDEDEDEDEPDCDCGDACSCDDNDGCQGCLQDNDVWSTQ